MAQCMLVPDAHISPCTIKDNRTSFSEKNIRKAIRRNDKKTIVKLIEGINAGDIRDHEGSTLLHMAIELRNYEILKFFIIKGCDVNAQDGNGATPLLNALKLSRWQAVDKLFKEEANLFLADNEGINALKLALQDDQKHNRAHLIDLLSKQLLICGLNGKELAPLVLEAGWPLHYAISIRNSELIKFMIEAGCSINSRDEFTDNMTALHKAIFNADIESTKILLQYGADIDVNNKEIGSPFEVATEIKRNMNFEIFEIFLKHELQRFNTDGMIYSYGSFSCANAQVMKLLVKYKVNLTTRDRRGSTIWHNLVFNRDPEAIYSIPRTEVDVNNKDLHGNTALHNAATAASLNCLKALIRKGADINVKNKNGHTPLTKVIYHRESEKIIETLIENGAISDEKIQNEILNYIIDMHMPTSNIRTILKQMAIMHLRSEALSERNIRVIKDNFIINDLFELYCQEVDSMKQKQVTENSHITVLDILCGSKYQLLCYTRNEELVRNFFEIQVLNLYPSYGEKIISRFQRACVYRNWTQSAIDVLSSNIKQLNCNLAIIANIIKFLNPSELAILHQNR